VTLRATVTPASGLGLPSGLVSFLDGATVLGSGPLDNQGRVNITTVLLGVGSDTITAVYAGDTNFTGSTCPGLGQTVSPSLTGTSIGSSASSSTYGQQVIFTAIVISGSGSSIPTGAVTFRDGAAVLGTATLDAQGQATYSTGLLGVGSHTVTVTYSGDINFTASTSLPLAQTINGVTTTTSVTSSNLTTVYGQAVTFTATVAAASGLPTGLVTFLEGTTVLGTAALNAQDQATFTTVLLGIGSHTLTAVYGGDANCIGSTSLGVVQTVSPSLTAAGVASSTSISAYGQQVTFTAVVVSGSGSGMPTGTVTFLDGATVLGAGTLNTQGQTTFTTALLGVGSHTITVVYAGDPSFMTSTSAALPVTVNPAAISIAVTSSSLTAEAGQAVTFTATITPDIPGTAVPTGGLVTFLDGTTVLGTGTLNAQGQATFTATQLSAGIHDIVAVYGGDPDFTALNTIGLIQTVIAV
jgi:hypothetical protein